MLYAIIDVEATGGSPRRDRLTEVAIYLFDGQNVVDHFQTLINPEINISPFITSLTGITDEMVAESPKFHEIAKRIIDITHNAVFVAHNVQFDYGYVKASFRRLGYTYSRPQLCTIELAKKILPGLASYGLDNLCDILDIANNNRHRAGGDAEATLALFQYLLNKDPKQYIAQTLDDSVHYKNIPANLTAQQIHDLSEEAGVYYFHNDQKEIIYVGKSVDIKRRVLQHFQKHNTHATNKQWRMLKAISDISFEETGSELIALLLESYQIQRLRPMFNRVQNPRRGTYYGIFRQYTADGYAQLYVKKMEHNDRPISVYDREVYAKNALAARMEKYRLCQNLCSRRKIPHSTRGTESCIYEQMKQCGGACIGKESADVYNGRVRLSFKDLAFPHANFLIVGDGRHAQELSVVAIKGFQLVGYGYAPVHHGDSISDLYDCVSELPYNPYTNKIIADYLKKNKYDKILAF
ncbi:MAG: GIY-YIG nuclease family protein [Chitinophagales bacterium]|nr:GIY-YIG nuclease family protein [Chitinophagales bacterium]